MARKLRILLVDDDAVLYRDVSRWLEGLGHEVLRSANTAVRFLDNYDDAVAVVEESIPDLAILDIELRGGKSGLELGEWINENYWLPIIYLTANYGKENRLEAGEQYARGFIAKIGKPIDTLQLELDIDRLTPLAHLLAKQKTLGDFFTVSGINTTTGKRSEFYIRKKIEWEQVRFITTVGAQKNKVVFYLTDGSQWVLHEALVKVEKRMPPFILRFTDQYIVNIKQLDRGGRANHVYYVGDLRLEIGKEFRESAQLMIRLFFPSR